ncbi:electron transfer flavoprotein beta [Striga asiatica]|uniref:Electron transfer flavoprotein beta n=1 Tax=Striga asiatica TaxID=4170 RepID=A0A5A7R2S8_STRAF|nr:electron transfer flavoprotein beta [Striga asiatica]
MAGQVTYAIDIVSDALDSLPIALELLFKTASKPKERLARVSLAKSDSYEEMIHGLILSAIHNHTNIAFAQAFVAKLLRDFSSKEFAKKVLDKAFETIKKVVKQSLEEYSSLTGRFISMPSVQINFILDNK